MRRQRTIHYQGVGRTFNWTCMATPENRTEAFITSLGVDDEPEVYTIAYAIPTGRVPTAADLAAAVPADFITSARLTTGGTE